MCDSCTAAKAAECKQMLITGAIYTYSCKLTWHQVHSLYALLFTISYDFCLRCEGRGQGFDCLVCIGLFNVTAQGDSLVATERHKYRLLLEARLAL